MRALGTVSTALFLFSLAASACPQAEPGESFFFSCGGKDYQLAVRWLPSGESFVVLSDGKTETLLGGAGGENLFPVAQVSGERFYILWVRIEQGQTGLGLYDSLTAASRSFPLPGFKFAGSPFLFERAGQPSGVIFLGNNSANDDVFFLDLMTSDLTDVTRTPWSEKRFVVEAAPEGFRLRTVSLRDRALYLLATGERVFRLLSRDPLPASKRRTDLPSPREEQQKQEEDCRPANTFVAFGDSITAGKMRMLDLEGEMHPELAYPEKMRELLATFYGASYPINLGEPGDSTYDGALRVDQDLSPLSALYFVLMLGTNDCISNLFSVDSSIENLAYIINAARGRKMRVIVSTIPPRKDGIGSRPYVRSNIAAFNQATAELAVQKGIGFIDTYGAFMATNPPDGWKALLEDIVGNHPSPAGHLVIAGLFADVLAAYAPLHPTGVEDISMDWPFVRQFRWDPGCESDLSHYRVEYGDSRTALKYSAVTSAPWFDFSGFGGKDVYFRVRAVDSAGHEGSPTRIFTTADSPRAPRQAGYAPAVRRSPPDHRT